MDTSPAYVARGSPGDFLSFDIHCLSRASQGPSSEQGLRVQVPSSRDPSQALTPRLRPHCPKGWPETRGFQRSRQGRTSALSLESLRPECDPSGSANRKPEP